VNDVLLDAYLDGVNYFRLMLGNGTSRTGFDVANQLPAARQHGVVAEISRSTNRLAAILVGAAHFDVFGWFLPLNSPTVESASQTVCDIYASRGMSRVLRGGRDVTEGVRWNSTVDEHLATFDRYK